MGFLVKKAADEIVVAKVTLTSADLLTPGFIYNIPEYPAVPGYFWNTIYMNGNIINGTIPYLGTSAIHIQAETATSVQFRFVGAFMQNITNYWIAAGIAGTTNIQYAVNNQLQIHNPGILTLGDNELYLYIGANLIKY